VNACSQPSTVNGWGMNVRRTESGSVLNEVITDQANGRNISNAYAMRNA
jgi:hypothetical protein